MSRAVAVLFVLCRSSHAQAFVLVDSLNEIFIVSQKLNNKNEKKTKHGQLPLRLLLLLLFLGSKCYAETAAVEPNNYTVMKLNFLCLLSQSSSLSLRHFIEKQLWTVQSHKVDGAEDEKGALCVCCCLSLMVVLLRRANGLQIGSTS